MFVVIIIKFKVLYWECSKLLCSQFSFSHVYSFEDKDILMLFFHHFSALLKVGSGLVIKNASLYLDHSRL
jgi:hypothetical protein